MTLMECTPLMQAILAMPQGYESLDVLLGASPRSPHWDATRNTYLLTHNFCVACGGKTELNVHHKLPFHLFPHLELDPSNFITLCENANRLCHFRIGHCFLWAAYNPHVEEDAILSMKRITERLMAA